jgi:hypothetical protein
VQMSGPAPFRAIRRRVIWVGGLLVIGGIATAPFIPPRASTNWASATGFLSAAYVDTPNLVRMVGVLACVVTRSAFAEGSGSAGRNQHVVIIRSTDGGATWGSPIEVEPAAESTSSWGIPYYDGDSDLLYVFYAFNVDGVTSTPLLGGGTSNRTDSVGALAYRTSSDRGLSWSARTILPIPTTHIDKRNAYNGSKVFFWLSDTVKFFRGNLYLSLSKVTDMGFRDTEAFVAKIPLPPTSIELLSSGSDGLVADDTFGATHITEEPTPVFHADGLITVFARTDRGRLFEAWSTDGGATFTRDWARQADGASYVAHPRAAPAVWQLPDGRFLLWTHNNTGTTFHSPRNPVWYRLGVRAGNRILWGRHHLLTWSNNPKVRISYPSMLVDGDDLIFAASDKGTAAGGYGVKLIRLRLADLRS